MAGRIDPAAYSNAFGRQVTLGANLRASDQDEQIRANQIAQMQEQNALRRNPSATPEQFIRGGLPGEANALAGLQDSQRQRSAEAFPRVGAIAAQVASITDPAQKRLAFKQAITSNSDLFDTMGIPHTEALAKLDATDDATLDATLAKLASFAPAAAPLKVGAGDSLVRPTTEGKFESVFTAPTKPAGEADGFSLSPGQVRFGPDGKRIAAVDAAPDQNATNTALAALRDDFRLDSKDFLGVANAYQRITDSAANPSAAGDIALLFNYLKVLDPGSTVREGEFQTVGNAGGLPARVQGLFNKLINGKLPDDVRTDVVGRATQLYRGQEGRFKTQVLDRYQGLYKRAGGDPGDLSDPRAAVPTSSLPPQNEKGWALKVDKNGARAYVSPDGKQFDEVQ